MLNSKPVVNNLLMLDHILWFGFSQDFTDETVVAFLIDVAFIYVFLSILFQHNAKVLHDGCFTNICSFVAG